MLNIVGFFKNVFYYRFFNHCVKKSYSQCGEDLIVDYVFRILGIENPVYLDIGANNPIALNNTYKFYLDGCRGFLVEPDPQLYNLIRSFRNRDVTLNIGLGSKKGFLNYYVMSVKTLNTFSKDQAQKCVKGYYHGKQRIEEIKKIKVESVSEVIKNNIKRLNFVSLDVEGMEMEILKSFPFKKIRPEVFCIETLEFDNNDKENKNNDIIKYMVKTDYFVYADTRVNTIFVDNKKWKR